MGLDASRVPRLATRGGRRDVTHAIPRIQLGADKPKHARRIHSLRVPEPCEDIAAPAVAVAVDGARIAAPVAQHAPVPGATLHPIGDEVLFELDQSVMGKLAKLGAELRVGIREPRAG